MLGVIKDEMTKDDWDDDIDGDFDHVDEEMNGDLKPEDKIPSRKSRRGKKKETDKGDEFKRKVKGKTMTDVWMETKLNYDDYMQTLDKDQYQCIYKSCDKVIKHRGDSIAHIFKHLNMRPFQCDQCEQEHSNIKDLQYHRRTHERKFKCDQCTKAFPTMNKLQVHVRIHTGIQLIR